MTLCQRSALISADARLLYRRLDNLEKDQAPLDKEQAEGRRGASGIRSPR